MIGLSIVAVGLDTVRAAIVETTAALEIANATRVDVGTSLFYAEFVHNGTGVYAGHSAWDVYGYQNWPGAEHPVMHTHHEGQQPQPFLTDAATATAPLLAQNIGEAVVAIANGGGRDQIRGALLNAGVAIRDQAIANIHNQSGTLAASITVDVV